LKTFTSYSLYHVIVTNFWKPLHFVSHKVNLQIWHSVCILSKSQFSHSFTSAADFSLCYILSLRAWTHSAVVSRVKTYKQLWSWDMGTYAGTQPTDDHIRITSVHIYPIHSMYPAQLLLTKINLCIYLGVKKSTVLIYTLPHNTFQSLRSSWRPLSSVALAIKFHISDTCTYITPVKSYVGSCVPDCTVTYWSHNFDSKFIGWLTKKSCSTPSRGKKFFVSQKFGTWPSTQWALGSFSQGQPGQGVKLAIHF